jgi:hypothetical protein
MTMKKLNMLFLMIIISPWLVLGQSNQKETKDITAYIVKVIRDVDMRAPSKSWEKAVPLSQLKSGYEIKTDKNSLAMILFADQSKLIIREKSIVTIRGEVQGKQIINREVHMAQGNLLFNVKKAETEQFRFSTPISVASIRGTQGSLRTSGSEDNLIIREGLAEFTNLLSGRRMNVGSGQRGTADTSGNLQVDAASEDELSDIDQGQNIQEEQPDKGEGQQSTLPGVNFSKLKSTQDAFVKINLDQIKVVNAAAVHFYHRKVNEPEFIDMLLTIAGRQATGKIEGKYIQYPKLEYYLVCTLADGSTITVPEGGSTTPAAVNVEPIHHELRIPGQTGSLQKKVLIIKWDE